LVLISLLFLLVCALNLTGLLLGKFLARANRTGVQRALGASRFAVFSQHIVECELVGVLGGFLGLGMAWFSLGLIGRLLPRNTVNPEMFSLDPAMLLVAFLLGLLASLIAGIYPAWRACTLSPAVQVKLQ